MVLAYYISVPPTLASALGALGWAEADVTVPRMLETALKFNGHPREEHTVGRR